MVVRMRSTRSHTGNRRSHHALTSMQLSKCPNCSQKHVRHQVCANCGQYKGRQVIDVTSILAKKETKRKARVEEKAKEEGKK